MRSATSLRLAQLALAGAMLTALLLLSACGGDSHLQQQTSSAQTQLSQLLQHAQAIGIPSADLQTYVQQEQKLNQQSAPFSPFDDSTDNTFYKNQTSSYQKLINQVQEEIGIVTGEDQGQAQQSLQAFQQILTTQEAKKVGDLQAFSLRYTADSKLLAAAQYPKDFLAVAADAATQTSALDLMSSTYGQLVIFHNTISQMQQAHLDVTVMQTQYTNDLSIFNTSTSVKGFQNLSTILDAQYQETVVSSTQSLPYVGAAKLQEFQTQISLLKTYGMDASSFQTLYNKDAAAMAKAQTISQYLAVSKQIDTDMNSMQDALIQGAAQYQVTELNNEANAWGQAHLYHDSYDHNNYILDSGYTMNGIGYWLDEDLSWAYSTSDYQQIVNDENNEFFDFQMFQQDYSDKTPYNQVHQTDLEMMQHYPSLQHGVVLMVSEVEQAMRVYDNGKLINAFLVTTGRPELPSLPGVWLPVLRESPTTFTSSDPKSSPYWYPPTPINYAIEYHYDGYFVHDAWWRDLFGPGTEFPHYDPSGDSFAFSGSHGCVNMQEQQAGWVYAHTDYNTQIAIY